MRLGEHDLSTTKKRSLKSHEILTEMVIEVASYTNHESYSFPEPDNDITIIELAQEVDLRTFTPACLAKTSDTFDAMKAWAYGEIILPSSCG